MRSSSPHLLSCCLSLLQTFSALQMASFNQPVCVCFCVCLRGLLQDNSVFQLTHNEHPSQLLTHSTLNPHLGLWNTASQTLQEPLRICVCIWIQLCVKVPRLRLCASAHIEIKYTIMIKGFSPSCRSSFTLAQTTKIKKQCGRW